MEVFYLEFLGFDLAKRAVDSTSLRLLSSFMKFGLVPGTSYSHTTRFLLPHATSYYRRVPPPFLTCGDRISTHRSGVAGFRGCPVRVADLLSIHPSKVPFGCTVL